MAAGMLYGGGGTLWRRGIARLIAAHIWLRPRQKAY